MSQGAKNIHAMAAALRRLEQECLDGKRSCQLHPDRRSTGYITHWSGAPMPCCDECAAYGVRKGMAVHRGDDEGGE